MLTMEEFNTRAREINMRYNSDSFCLIEACKRTIVLADQFLADNPYDLSAQVAAFHARIGIYIKAVAKDEIAPETLYHSAHTLADVCIQDDEARQRAVDRFVEFEPEHDEWGLFL